MPMADEFEEKYPEAVPRIWEAVRNHGEDWVVEHYHQEFSQLGQVMSIPDVEELPFYDETRRDEHRRAHRDGTGAR